MHEQEKGDYYYGSKADQYTFYRLPKVLFTDTRYKCLSDGAKILYGLMLDRMALSVKNGWTDERNQIFIYFTLEDVQEYMNCKQDKGVKMLAELDSIKGVGLIERVKRGQGKPTVIYVKKFVHPTEAQTSEKPKSGLLENRGLDFGETECSNTYDNNNKVNDTEYQSVYPPPARVDQNDRLTDRMDEIAAYRAMIMDNIEYDTLRKNYGHARMDEIVAVLLDAVCTTKPYLRVDGEDKPAEIVKSRLLKLDPSHIEYCVERLDQNTTKVSNIKAYLLTALYNAPATIDHYYRAEVNHDMRGGP